MGLLTCLSNASPHGEGTNKRGWEMLRRNKRLSAGIAVAGTLLGTLGLAPATIASAAPTSSNAPTWSTFICRGTAHHPGLLLGTYWDVIVRGVCAVNRGPVVVQHNLWVGGGSTLLAAYGRHHSRLIVDRDIIVKAGGTLLLGCEAKHFACLDDPHPKRPSLASHSTVYGNVIGDSALGIVVHNSSIEHSVQQIGGGGGTTCKPRGIFKRFKSPVYSDYEDNFIRGTLVVRHLHSCWFGAIRNFVASSVTVSSNRLADPDAMEVVNNVVLRNLICWNNSPRVQFGDSHGKPNRVGWHALFECGFHVLRPNPAGQHHHFEHISVHLHH